ncbi:hypothetical protein DCAR_0416617 [Daucus carota subsp. sativus]|uniref:Uncharacterized protein n=2 Tax=Daucus carota subsp. sativus TaxID=79200 RepID=A0AAF1AY05_DAUCS|nr:hypothetical protein DCAR_0416617 [Daucus carota subsp. sativus]
MQIKAAKAVVNAKAACSSTFGLGEDSIHTSSVFAMPMVSSKINGFRGTGVDRAKYFSWRDIGRNSDISLEEHDLESASMLPRS